MDQNNLDTSNPISPQPEMPSQPPVKKGWPLSRKATIIVVCVAALVLVIAIGIIFLMVNSKGSKQQADTARDSSLYYSRPGYSEDNAGIGDAAALASETTANLVTYGEASALQPCTLFTLTDLQSAGLKLTPNQLTGPVTQNTFDGRGTAAIDKSSGSFLPSDSNAPSCQYYLLDNKVIDITAYQPSFTNVAALDYELGRRFTAVADVEGLRAYKVTKANSLNADEATYMLREGNTAVQIRFDVPEEVKSAILKQVAKRFAQVKTTPTPTQKYTFKSPVFPVSSISSCDIFDASAFRAITGAESSPLVSESFGSAVGVITFNKNYNYMSYECKRSTADRYISDASTVRLSVVTYETAEAAQQDLKFERGAQPFTQNLQEIMPAIGDESYFADVASGKNTLVFRKGRVVIRTTLYTGPKDASITAEKRIQMLTPTLNTIASERLKDY